MGEEGEQGANQFAAGVSLPGRALTHQPMRSSLEWLTRLLLGVVLLPVVCLAACLVSLLAACCDRSLPFRRWARRHKWALTGQ